MNLLTLPEAAALIGLHRNTLLHHVRQGNIQAIRVGRGWLIDRQELDRFAAIDRKTGPKPQP